MRMTAWISKVMTHPWFDTSSKVKICACWGSCERWLVKVELQAVSFSSALYDSSDAK